MVGARVDIDIYFGSSSNAHGSFAWAELITTNVVTAYVADETIVLPVLGLSHCGPWGTTVDERECVCETYFSTLESKLVPSVTLTVSIDCRYGSEENRCCLHICS